MSKDYKIHLRKKTDKELITILYFEKEKYNKEAIVFVNELILERKIDKKEIAEIKNEIRKKRIKEQKKVKEEESKNKGCIGVLIDLFLQG